MNTYAIAIGAGGWLVIGPVDPDEWDGGDGIPHPASTAKPVAGPFDSYAEAEAEVRRLVAA